jgi:hypothetical protein
MWKRVAVLCAVVASGIACARQKSTVVPPESHPAAAQPAVQEFKEAVARLQQIHEKAERTVPALDRTATAQQIADRRRALRKAVEQLRPGVKQGVVFTPAVQQYFLQVIRSEVKGRSGAPTRELTQDGNPSREGNNKAIPLLVGAEYPENQPLSTVPPTVLLRLPRLPDIFDYRFVGRSLVLRDVDANVILDYIKNAIPLP